MSCEQSESGDGGGTQTYSPEYADLPVTENSLDGYKGRRCPECGELGSNEDRIALERDDGTYSCWVVWYCNDCDMRWRATSRPLLSPFSTTTERPKMHGYEVVGHE